MKALLPLLFAAAVMAAPAPALARSCLPYGPFKVTLSGMLERKVSSAASSAIDANLGDRSEATYFLQLPSPLCVAASVESGQHAHDAVRELQLVLDSAQFAHLAGEMHETVRLTGTLSEGAANATPLLLRVEAIDGD